MLFSALNHYRDAVLQVLKSGIRPQSIKHGLCRDIGQHVRSLAVGPLQTLQSMIVVPKPDIDK